jgi:putative nucleotidyltransferase with HDIG domain
MGYATFPDDEKSREKLLKKADQAVHLAKYQKENQFVYMAAHQAHLEQETVLIEVFASQVAKKYEQIHLPGSYEKLIQSGSRYKGKFYIQAEEVALETITSLAGALEAKDRYTRGHSQAVANYAVVLANALKMTPPEVEEIRGAAFLHDIGKIGIPEYILGKQGALNEKEWEIMKQHPVIGAQQILYPLKSLRALVPAVECHHEDWDGSGHPHGYKGEKIPIGARIISIVDVFHALTSDRSYRKALSVEEAKHIMSKGAGQKWDPYLLDVFFTMLGHAKKTA